MDNHRINRSFKTSKQLCREVTFKQGMWEEKKNPDRITLEDRRGNQQCRKEEVEESPNRHNGGK